MLRVSLCLPALALAAACSKAEPPSAEAKPAPAPEAKAGAKADPAPQGATPVTTKNDPSLPAAGTAPPPVAVGPEFASVWTTPIKTLSGKDAKLDEYKGKALLVVNVASKCGLTPQYTALEALQKKYADKGFSVVGFPCNQFGGQEPGTAEEIQTFCSTKYGVTFPIMEKVDVNGAGANPIYKTLTQIPDAKGEKGDIQWNFEKFVVSADGTQVTRFRPKTTPDDPAVIAAIENALPR
jgi:glutathione peroxidase